MIKKTLLRLLFLLFLVAGIYYTLYMQTEKYRSYTTVMVKNLSEEQSISAIGAILMPESSGVLQDSSFLELYLRSIDVYHSLDEEYNLTDYYTSLAIDSPHRLYAKNLNPYVVASQENLLDRYNKDLTVAYDQPSSVLTIEFLHADANTSRDILRSILRYSGEILNQIEKKNAEVILSFLKKQAVEKKERFLVSVKKLISYQNTHNTIDPKIDVETKSKLMANLEAELIKNQVKYKSQTITKKQSAPTMRELRSSIRQIKQNIQKIKNEIAGKSSRNNLNSNVFDFEILKNEMEFDRELYKQTLIKVEETKVNLNKKAKNLIVINQPVLPDRYSMPDKPAQILSMVIILSFIYGILVLVFGIIRSHRD